MLFMPYEFFYLIVSIYKLQNFLFFSAPFVISSGLFGGILF